MPFCFLKIYPLMWQCSKDPHSYTQWQDMITDLQEYSSIKYREDKVHKNVLKKQEHEKLLNVFFFKLVVWQNIFFLFHTTKSTNEQMLNLYLYTQFAIKLTCFDLS